MAWVRVPGVVTPGYQNASGRNPHTQARYGAGTLELQFPIFKQMGLDLSACFAGTLNVRIVGTFRLLGRERVFRNVRWFETREPETFYFSACRLYFRGKVHAAWVYYPVKKPGVKNLGPSTFEIVAEFIPGISYGDVVEIEVNLDEVEIVP